MAQCKGVPHTIPKLKRAGLPEATMLCNAEFSCGPAVHCLQQVPAMRNCKAWRNRDGLALGDAALEHSVQLDLQQTQQQLPAFWSVCMLRLRSVSQHVLRKSMMPCSALQVSVAAESSAGLYDLGSHPEGHQTRPKRARKKSKPYWLGSQQ